MVHIRLVLFTMCVGCLPDLVPDPGDPDALAPEVSTNEDGLAWSVDATNEEEWVGVNLLDGLVVDEGAGQMDMLRFNIRLNPGWEATWVDGNDLKAAPANGRLDG